MNPDSDLNTKREAAIEEGLAEARKGAVVAALIIICIGVVLLLNQLGVLPPGLLFIFWPSLLIVFGLGQMLVSQGWQRASGGALVLIGALIQLRKLGIIRFGLHDLWPLFIIAAGAALLWNTLREKPPGSTPRSAFFPEFNSTYIFSGTDRKVDTKNFRGGKIAAVFGGFKIDLTRSDLEGSEAVLQVDAVFGGGEIVVPDTWRIVVEGAGVFGAFEDQTRLPAEATKTLFVRGAAVFGGVVVRNPH
ncbi:MAG TPA: DUF5668 domain-containing protein [Candidatus Angelobacter sp.]|jgi:predicted membrane protein|nr:DUF5668 domain-containing protein [Candidatus Angelobacter sp.]